MKLKIVVDNSKIEDLLDEILNLLTEIRKGETKMAGEVDRLTTEVSEAVGVMESAKVLITGLAQEIRDAIGNATKLTQLSNDLDSKATELAAAIAASSDGGTVIPPVDPNA